MDAKIGDAPPAGLILHTVSDLGGDKWKLVDVWESAENFQTFVQDQLIPAIAEVNPDAPQARGARDPRGTHPAEGLSRTDPLTRLKEKTVWP